MRNLTIGQAVNFVAAPEKDGGKPTTRKGTITDLHPTRIELAPNEHVQAEYSAGGEIGTFHFADEAKEVKKEPTAFKPAPNENNSAGGERLTNSNAAT